MSIDTEPGWRSEEDPSVIPEGVPVPMTVRNDGSASMIQPGDRPEALNESHGDSQRVVISPENLLRLAADLIEQGLGHVVCMETIDGDIIDIVTPSTQEWQDVSAPDAWEEIPTGE